MERSKSIKGQIYWIDYSIALFLFIAMLSLFLVSIDNFTSKDEFNLNSVQKQSEMLSKILMQEGSPKNWESSNFSRIGLKGGNAISKLNIYEFNDLGFSGQKNALRLVYPFEVVFTNGTGALQNLGGVCGFGNITNLTRSNNLAYYYKESFTDYLYNNISALGKIFNSPDTFFNRINNFSLVVLDNPNFNDDGLYTFAQKRNKLESFVGSGNNLIFSGYLGGDMFEIHFKNLSGNNITILNRDSAFPFEVNMRLNMNYEHVLNGSVKTIGMGKNNSIVSAKWKYGNGTIYYISNYTLKHNGASKNKNVLNAIKFNIIGSCKSYDFSAISTDALVKVERLCLVNDKIMTMGVYSWK